MKESELERPLGNGALREIERSLRRKLRSHRLSESFIDRYGDDALQKGLVEYLRAREAGREIHDPGGFVVQAAFRRAIDELRREAHEADGAAVDALLGSGRSAAPPAEDVAIAQISAAELHAAIDLLPAEERQALSLYYFEELSNDRAAEVLYCSERTFRRTLKAALSHLSRAIGAPAPEPGSDLALEVGLVSWVSLGGARVLVSAHPLAPLTGALETGAQFVARQLDRIRDPATRLSSSGTSEQISALASGPAGKVIGGCAGAAIVCALTGVVATNVDLGGKPSSTRENHHPTARHAAAIEPVAARVRSAPPDHATQEIEREPARATTASPREPKSQRSSQADHGDTGGETNHQASRRKAEEVQMEEEMSGITKAAQEAEAEPPPSTSGAAPVEAAPTEGEAPKSTSSPSAAKEKRQAEQQFRGPLAP